MYQTFFYTQMTHNFTPFHAVRTKLKILKNEIRFSIQDKT